MRQLPQPLFVGQDHFEGICTHVDFYGKTVVIPRGLPGTVKTYTSEQLVGDLLKWDYSAVRHETDASMYDRGQSYEVRHLPECHQKCKESVLRSMCEKIEVIFVSNTNIQIWEFAEYLLMAALHGYSVVILDMILPEQDALIVSKRNVHDVPVNIVERMIEQYEPWPGIGAGSGLSNPLEPEEMKLIATLALEKKAAADAAFAR